MLKTCMVPLSLEQSSHLPEFSNDNEWICAYSEPLLSSCKKDPS